MAATYPTLPRIRATVLLLLAASILVACAGPGPLSRSRPAAATTAPPAPPSIAPAPTYPPPEVPIPPLVPAPPPTVVTGQPTSDTICIVLPLESPLYGPAAAAVKAGFLADGARTMATVASDAPLQRRFKTAFSAAWERLGGSTPRDYRFDPHPEVLSLLRRELLARPPDATLLAVNSDEAPLAKSFLPPGPVYASSQIADGVPAPILRDLEGVRYVEIPWLADPAGV